jgi:uncharacterized cupin superfamily protein
MSERPACIVHWTEIENPEASVYSGTDEKRAHNAALGRHYGLRRLGIHHARLPPGRRLSFPHAESAEEEFVHVIEGTPDVWLDGHLHRLRPGDSVGFVPGTGLAHTFINNTDGEVRLLVVGDTDRAENRIHYPLNPERRPLREDWWDDVPARERGPHDGLPDALRADRSTAEGRK